MLLCLQRYATHDSASMRLKCKRCNGLVMTYSPLVIDGQQPVKRHRSGVS